MWLRLLLVPVRLLRKYGLTGTVTRSYEFGTTDPPAVGAVPRAVFYEIEVGGSPAPVMSFDELEEAQDFLVTLELETSPGSPGGF